ncbi:MAG TPA: biotin synthase BioB [Nitrospirae bacterium]|nr:biotin synthase BioB [Nitrospirota bacterium]
MLEAITDKALASQVLSQKEAMYVATEAELPDLLAVAAKVRELHMGKMADFCAIVSAKTGACQEDCSYCAQSARSKARLTATPLISKAEVIEKARSSKEAGAKRFCIVTSGRAASDGELESIAGYVSAVREEALAPCATLGLLGTEELKKLKKAGLNRYHHNLETSRRYFPEVCSTHTYDQKLETIRAAKDAGLSVCSGGIFGLGESWEDRIEMARELHKLDVDSIPINFLVPIPGTPLGKCEPLPPFEALRIISLYRLLLPDRQIRVCGGRLQTLGAMNSMVFMAGADGLLTGDCLTVAGCKPDEDMELARAYGLEF